MLNDLKTKILILK